MSLSPTKHYALITAALLGLLVLTVAAAYVNLGPLNTVIAMLIALAKASLIVLFFMHVRRSKPVAWIFVLAGFFWLGILITLAFSDYLTRA